jgi:hypothetical protein
MQAYVVVSSDKYLGPQHDPDIPHSFRIPVLTRPAGKSHPGAERTQLPLIAAAGITVHKSQGMSLAIFKARFGASEIAIGSTYVQLSRVMSLAGLILEETLTLQRLVGLSRSDRADQRLAFDLKCDAGVLDTLRKARSACGPDDFARADALDADITEAETELSRARDLLQRRLTAKAMAKADAAAKAAARKKQRTT